MIKVSHISEIAVRRRHFLCCCFLLSGLQIANIVVAKADSITTLANPTEKDKDGKLSIREWFENYDQIRRSAEMTLFEKLQTRFALERGGDSQTRSGKSNRALAKRMLSKYTKAIADMKKLQAPPETKELHDGYIRYFTDMQQLFVQSFAPESDSDRRQFLLSQRRTLEELDRNNKKLDEELRRQNGIPRHRHS
jgi:hypothetical protein